MSQKSGKKLRKREDDKLEMSTKLIAVEKSDVPNVGNGLLEEESSNLQDKVVESEVNGTNDTDIINEPTEAIQHRELQEIIFEEKITIDHEEIQGDETLECKETVKIIEIFVSDERSDESQEKEDEGVEKQDVNKDVQLYQDDTKAEPESESKADADNELEPLLLESEEPEPELEFEENSDIDSQKSSPIIRCATRRSQTRNIPIPKTPKSIDTNSEDKTSECSDKPSVVTVPTPEVTDTESELSVFKPVTDIYDNQKLLVKVTDDDFDSFENASTKAIVGNDTTRNVDFTSYPDDELELSPFLVQSRDRSVGETLKLLTSRRSIRSTKDHALRNNNKKDYKRFTIDKLVGTKRKCNNDSPDYTKRFKMEPSPPHLLSYISSPINTFKNRFNKSEIPSSTPKLTSYISKNVFDNTNVSKITLNETENVAEKKWCTVM